LWRWKKIFGKRQIEKKNKICKKIKEKEKLIGKVNLNCDDTLQPRIKEDEKHDPKIEKCDDKDEKKKPTITTNSKCLDKVIEAEKKKEICKEKIYSLKNCVDNIKGKKKIVPYKIPNENCKDIISKKQSKSTEKCLSKEVPKSPVNGPDSCSDEIRKVKEDIKINKRKKEYKKCKGKDEKDKPTIPINDECNDDPFLKKLIKEKKCKREIPKSKIVRDNCHDIVAGKKEANRYKSTTDKWKLWRWKNIWEKTNRKEE